MAAAEPGAIDRLRSLGWRPEAIARLEALCGGGFETPMDILRMLDNFPYEHDWAADYQIRSAQASLLRPRIMCINAAILSYALLEAFPRVPRRLLALHRRGPDGVECGHVVTVYRTKEGRFGAFSKSNYAVLDHRPARFASLQDVAMSYARGYLSMGFTPLYYGSPNLEALPVDWRLGDEPITPHLGCFTDSYEYEFDLQTSAGQEAS